MSTTITISKVGVYEEVAKITEYIGAKKAGDGSLYEQVAVNDDDRLLLERFFNEAANTATDMMKRYILSVSSAAQPHGIDLTADYSATLNLPSSFNSALVDSIKSSLFSFFANYIAGQWLAVASKDDSSIYASLATGHLADAKAKIFHKKKPVRSVS